MNLTTAEFDKLIRSAAQAGNIPLSGDFQITPRCNLDCVMCYIRKEPSCREAISNELSAKEIISILKEARDAGMLYVLFTGGEIFLREDFREIYESAMQMGLLVTLFTNATLITPQIADWLADNPPYKVAVTMYGASPETYEQVSRSKMGYERTVQGIDLLIGRNIRVELKTTWLKENIKDYYKLYAFAKDRGLNLKSVNYVFPSFGNCGNDYNKHRLDAEEWANFEAETEAFISEDIGLLYNSIQDTSLIEVQQASSDDMNRLQDYSCAAGITSFSVNWKGDMMHCSLVETMSISLKEFSFVDGWEKVRCNVQTIPKCEECEACEYRASCMTCHARLFLETGAFNKPASYLCTHAKKRHLLINKKF